MNFSIRRKLIIGFGLVLLMFIGVILYNVYAISKSKQHITHIKEFTEKQVSYTDEIKIAVIQVQQWLTDASATRTEDGFDVAKKYKNRFFEASGKLDGLEGLSPEVKVRLQEITKEFNEFYELGVKMANAYVRDGIEKGNELMEQFDPKAEDLFNRVDKLQLESKEQMEQNLDTIQNHLDLNLQISLITGILSIIFAILIIILIGHQISVPINNLLFILTDIEKGEGDLTKRINIKSSDEIGKMAQAFNKFLDKLEGMVAEIKRNFAVVSHGSEILNSGGTKTAEGISHIKNHMDKVNGDTHKIKASIIQLTLGMEGIVQASQDNSSIAQEICNLTDNINAIAQESGKLAFDAKLEMGKIEKLSAETMDITEKLGFEAGEIGKITDTIKAITEQTNLLALNAAIEAARAGEQGKGFAVVADEIRKLAENNNQSAKMIEQLVNSIQDMIIQTVSTTSNTGTNIKLGGKIVERVYAQLEKIIDGISNINDRIQSIAASTEEQSASAEELSAAMEEISNSNSEITDSVDEVAASITGQVETVSSLSSTAHDLNESADQLNCLVNKFKLRA
ncbi:MAG: methyl-accepting chemotaxis protein [Clostridia bacterium]|nr:methyl-accepting chemotaxis protein [Clostridia bacterium]